MKYVKWISVRLLSGVLIGLGVVVGAQTAIRYQSPIIVEAKGDENCLDLAGAEDGSGYSAKGSSEKPPVKKIETIQSRAIVDESGFVRIVAEIKSIGGPAEYVQPAAHLFAEDGTFLFECTGNAIKQLEAEKIHPVQIDCYGMDEEVAERYYRYEIATR